MPQQQEKQGKKRWEDTSKMPTGDCEANTLYFEALSYN